VKIGGADFEVDTDENEIEEVDGPPAPSRLSQALDSLSQEGSATSSFPTHLRWIFDIKLYHARLQML
jgi:hypothetical protein